MLVNAFHCSDYHSTLVFSHIFTCILVAVVCNTDSLFICLPSDLLGLCIYVLVDSSMHKGLLICIGAQLHLSAVLLALYTYTLRLKAKTHRGIRLKLSSKK